MVSLIEKNHQSSTKGYHFIEKQVSNHLMTSHKETRLELKENDPFWCFW
jgi:hypothetical protein